MPCLDLQMIIRNICTILELTWTYRRTTMAAPKKQWFPNCPSRQDHLAGDLSLPNGLRLPLAPREVYRKLQRKSLRIINTKRGLRALTHSFFLTGTQRGKVTYLKSQSLGQDKSLLMANLLAFPSQCAYHYPSPNVQSNPGDHWWVGF